MQGSTLRSYSWFEPAACCRKFQEATLSTAMGNTRPDALSNRQAVLMIETSILSSSSSMLLSSAQLTIRIYQAFPTLADSMSGSLNRNKAQPAVTQPAARPKVLWQSQKLAANTQGAVIMDVECSAKAVDAVLDAASMSNKASLMQQVLQHLEQQSGVRLASKSAKVRE